MATKLKSAGFTEIQAKTLTHIQKQAIDSAIEQAHHDYHLDEIATKRDLFTIEHKIELLRAETKRDIAETKAELIRWVVGAGLLQTSLIIGALMKMAHLI